MGGNWSLGCRFWLCSRVTWCIVLKKTAILIIDIVFCNQWYNIAVWFFVSSFPGAKRDDTRITLLLSAHDKTGVHFGSVRSTNLYDVLDRWWSSLFFFFFFNPRGTFSYASNLWLCVCLFVSMCVRRLLLGKKPHPSGRMTRWRGKWGVKLFRDCLRAPTVWRWDQVHQRFSFLFLANVSRICFRRSLGFFPRTQSS